MRVVTGTKFIPFTINPMPQTSNVWWFVASILVTVGWSIECRTPSMRTMCFDAWCKPASALKICQGGCSACLVCLPRSLGVSPVSCLPTAFIHCRRMKTSCVIVCVIWSASSPLYEAFLFPCVAICCFRSFSSLSTTLAEVKNAQWLSDSKPKVSAGCERQRSQVFLWPRMIPKCTAQHL